MDVRTAFIIGRVCERLSYKKSKKIPYTRHYKGPFKNYVYKRRGVGGQKKLNLVNVVCERPLIRTLYILNPLFEGQKHFIGGFNGLKK